MRNKTTLLSVFFIILALLFTACSSDLPAAGNTTAGDPAPGPALSSGGEDTPGYSGYSVYSGYQFSGRDPWDGTLTVTITNMADGKMDWTFVDSYEDHTLFQVQKETAIQDMKAAFDIRGKDVQHEDISFAYQGSMELKDGKLAMTFDSGAVTDGASESASVLRDAASLSGSSDQVVLDRTADGPYMTYIVQEGDSAHSIAKKYGISTKDLCILNQVVIIETAKARGYEFDDVTEYAKFLFPGMELLVPDNE